MAKCRKKTKKKKRKINACGGQTYVQQQRTLTYKYEYLCRVHNICDISINVCMSLPYCVCTSICEYGAGGAAINEVIYLSHVYQIGTNYTHHHHQPSLLFL